MKKNLYFFLCMITLMSFSFVSCGDDDDDEKEQQYYNPGNKEDGEEFGFGNSTPEVNAVVVNLTVGDKFALPDATLGWISENTRVAFVSEDGNYIVGEHVGTTRVYGGTYKYTVIVNPKYTLYADPCTKWGATVDEVTHYMAAYKFYRQSGNYIYYYGKDAAGYYGYDFETGRLKFSMVFVDTDYAENLVDFLFERYLYAGDIENDGDVYFLFLNLSEDMLVTMSTSLVEANGKNYIPVLYEYFEPESEAKTRGGFAVNTEKIEELCRQMGVKKADMQVLTSEKLRSLK